MFDCFGQQQSTVQIKSCTFHRDNKGTFITGLLQRVIMVFQCQAPVSVSNSFCHIPQHLHNTGRTHKLTVDKRSIKGTQCCPCCWRVGSAEWASAHTSQDVWIHEQCRECRVFALVSQQPDDDRDEPANAWLSQLQTKRDRTAAPPSHSETITYSFVLLLYPQHF